MQSGMLDQQIVIKRQVKTSDGMGGHSTTLSTVDTVWANVRPITGVEKKEFQAVQDYRMYEFLMRDTANITEADTIVWNNIKFNVRAVLPFPRSTFLQVKAEKGAAI